MGCKNPKECDDSCPGWGLFNGCEIQRCDTCARFESDMAAVHHIASCVECQAELGRSLAEDMVAADSPKLFNAEVEQ